VAAVSTGWVLVVHNRDLATPVRLGGQATALALGVGCLLWLHGPQQAATGTHRHRPAQRRTARRLGPVTPKPRGTSMTTTAPRSRARLRGPPRPHDSPQQRRHLRRRVARGPGSGPGSAPAGRGSG
jgi:hypothetical protein